MKVICLKDMEFKIVGDVTNENCEHLVHAVYRAVLRAVRAKVDGKPVGPYTIQMPLRDKLKDDGYKSIFEESDDKENWTDVPVTRGFIKRYVRIHYHRPELPL